MDVLRSVDGIKFVEPDSVPLRFMNERALAVLKDFRPISIVKRFIPLSDAADRSFVVFDINGWDVIPKGSIWSAGQWRP